jgi:gluconate 5-dehydrogenase
MPRPDPFSLDGRIANGRSGPSLSEAVDDLRSRGITAHSRVCDVTSSDQVEAMLASIEDDIGPLDIVVNNAGVQQPGPDAIPG